jgi:hypothetical protein
MMSRWMGATATRLTAAAVALAAGLMAAPSAAASAGAYGSAGAGGTAAPHSGTAAPHSGSAAPGSGSGDSPAGFWYGTDSWQVTGTGSAPYHEPVIGGAYGGYLGMAGNWARLAGCGGKIAWSARNARQATADFRSYHVGIGTGAYWFMGGPGVDPHYNGTVAEAYAWGRRQAARALSDITRLSLVTYPVVFADVELPGSAPGITPAPDNGWNSVYTSPCSGRVRTGFIAPRVDRAALDGFTGYLRTQSKLVPGVYSAPRVWTAIFGTGRAASVPGLYEWTYTAGTSSLSRHPAGWCLPGTSICAQFFGGVTGGSSHALMWQWSGGGGTFNGHGDFDQIAASRTP